MLNYQKQKPVEVLIRNKIKDEARGSGNSNLKAIVSPKEYKVQDKMLISFSNLIF
jgi:hypothetical protein